MRQITRLQRNVLAFCAGHTEAIGYSPTIKEIQLGLKIKHVGTVQAALKGLESKRFIERKKRAWRNIIILQDYYTNV